MPSQTQTNNTMQKAILFFTSDIWHILPSREMWWAGTLISVEAINQDDAMEYVGALTNDRYSVWYDKPENMELVEAIVLPDGWQPCPAYLVCEQHFMLATLIKRFRVKSRASITKIEAKNYLRRLRDENPAKEYFLVNQIGQKI